MTNLDKEQSTLEQIKTDILIEMYNEAEPHLDFEQLQSNPDSYPEDWYEQHYLSGEEQERIVDKYVEKHDLTKQEKNSLAIECILNLGPTCQK